VSKTTPTVIVASSVLLREGIASVLQDTPYKVTAAVAKPTEVADHHFRNGRRALAIVGIEGQNEIDQAAESIRLLRSLIPDGAIVLVAETSRPVNLQSVLTLAPDGYILKVGSRDLLLKSFELIFMGQQLLVLGRPTAALRNAENDTQYSGGVPGSQSRSSHEFTKESHGIQFSRRERQVLLSVAHGEPNKGIARMCAVSEATVKSHLKAILRKINARNRTEAAIWAMDYGLADPDGLNIFIPRDSTPAETSLSEAFNLPAHARFWHKRTSHPNVRL
jgi:two-component system, NarL family, nitrate/nitrite response regulator NarL